MKKILVCVAGLSCLLMIGSSNTMAQQFYRGGSGLGISFGFGSGYNNFGGYNRGYRQPFYGGGYGGGGFYGGGYPVYRSTRVYSAPFYGGNYGGAGYYGGGRNYGGGYGRRHRHCR